jgi:hypothetical protein
MTIRGEPFLVITGELQHQGGAINVVARDIVPLEQARQHYGEISFEKVTLPTPRDLIDPVGRDAETSSLNPKSHNYH